MRKTKVYLVGAGPGSPGLITVRGLEILRQADVVIYDYLVGKGLLDQAKEGAELICCDRLGKKRYADGFFRDQDQISNLLIRKVKEGKKVIRLKNGDPSLFGRCAQELSALVKEKTEFEVVPGVTAASAASAFAGVPLTDRRISSSVVFVTGHEDPKKDKSLIDWGKLSSSSTIVLYMAVGNLSRIVGKLFAAGKPKDTPVVAVSCAGEINQRTVRARLGNIAEIAKKENIAAPAIFIIGPVAEWNKEFNWLKRNKRSLFTGLSRERFFTKSAYFHLPLIKLEPLEDYEEFDNHLKNIKEFDWVVFTSRYGAEYFFKRLNNLGFDTRDLSGIKIAAIGSSTKERLLDFGVRADLVPEQESSRGLFGKLREIPIKGKKIFLPRSDISDKGLGEKLRKIGAKVTASSAYRNVPAKELPDLDLNTFDEIIFTSPSTVRSFRKRYKKVAGNTRIKCIGDVTLKEAEKCRLLD